MNLTNLATQFGTPLYAYDAEMIKAKARELKQAFAAIPKTKFLFAVKANNNPAIVSLLKNEGFGVDAVSMEEVMLGLHAGVKPENIIYSAHSLSDDEMHACVKAGVLLNIGALSRLEKFGAAYPNSKVCVRFNPNVGAGLNSAVITGGPDSKFGILAEDINTVKTIAQKYNLHIVGVHCHIGSGWLTLSEPIAALQTILLLAKEFADLEFVDMGGGFGVPYKPEQTPLDLKTLGKEMATIWQQFLTEYKKELTLVFEPGRFLVAEAGVLLAEVCEKKRLGNGRLYAGVNSGFNHLIRPAFYGSYHQITNLTKRNDEVEPYDIGGNLCECADFFAKERPMTPIEEGDILAFHTAGAYGFSMANEYQLRSRPMEVLVNGEEISIIRKRKTIEELLNN